MKSLIEYTHGLILQRRLLKSDIIKLRADINHLERKIERLKEEAKEAEDIDLFNTKELNRLREEVIKLRNDAS